MNPRPINFRTLDLNLLRVFNEVMVERNVTRAAERLAMSQPAVSNALRRLRQATHAELFVPTSTGVMPTAQAQALWPVVRQALASLRQALAPQDFDARHEERRFTLAMADATAALFLPVLADALQREQAQVDLRVVSLTSRDPRPLLEQGEVDAALGFFPDVKSALETEGDGALTRLEPLYTCRYQAVMRRGHRLAAEGALTLDAYCEALHLRVNFAGRPQGFVDDALAKLGRRRRVLITVSQFATAGAMVQQSDLITVLPRSYVPATGFAAELVMRDLPFEMPRIDVGLLWHRRHEQDTAQHWLRGTLRQAATAVAGNLH
ncbi:MAG: LysR family transcriptional regulator [Burkholderiales bacterium]|nr:LysR family transcriptional regulator [Burkholderiales bacterium]